MENTANIKVVSFDMDGTIPQYRGRSGAAARRALKLAGLPPMPPVQFANYIGNGVKGIYRELCPDATQEKLEEAVRYQLEWYPSTVRNRPVLSWNVGDSAVDGCQRNPAGNCNQ